MSAELDFTSSLYLDLRHPSASLRGWTQLTAGVPAALGMPDGARRVGARLAELVGCDRASLFPSTLHALWDLFGWLCARAGPHERTELMRPALERGRAALLVDGGAYPVALWGVERAVARGARAARFAHHHPPSLRGAIARAGANGARPIVVTDGFCPSCGEPAPLDAYLAIVRARGGLLVVDDTQALGVLGSPALGAPYGAGGGGSLRWHGIGGDDVIAVASLAKAFGAPLAAVCGAHARIRAFERGSETRVHASTVSAAAVSAAEAALDANDAAGDARRRALHDAVASFRDALRERGLSASGGAFPVQAVRAPPGVDPIALYERLLQRGVRAVLLGAGCSRAPRREARIGFVLRAGIPRASLARAVDEIAACARRAARHRDTSIRNESRVDFRREGERHVEIA